MRSHWVLNSVVEYRAERERPSSPPIAPPPAPQACISFPRGNRRQHLGSFLHITIHHVCVYVHTAKAGAPVLCAARCHLLLLFFNLLLTQYILGNLSMSGHFGPTHFLSFVVTVNGYIIILCTGTPDI